MIDDPAAMHDRGRASPRMRGEEGRKSPAMATAMPGANWPIAAMC
jgi:hypothetical protein